MSLIPTKNDYAAVPVLLLFLALLFTILQLHLRYWGLRHIPGPFGARFTDLYLALKTWTNHSPIDLHLALRDKYGPVVLYGPRRVLFSDPSAISLIFNTKNALRKGESYETTSQAVKGKVIHTLVALRDEARVSAMKKLIISAFTTTAILDYEHHIDINIQRLMKQLSNSGDEVDISSWNSAYSYDTICRVAFSEDQGVLDAHKDAAQLFKASRDRFEHWYNWMSLPGLERLLFKNKIVTWKTGTSPLGQMASARLLKRTEDGGVGSHHDLLDRYLQAGTKDPQLFTPPTIIGLALSTIHAGAETTAHSLTITLYHLIHHPRAMAALRAELDRTKLSSPPSWNEVKNLPYLDAVFKESGRISPLLIGPVEREVPASGMEIAGTYLPGGTIVAMNVHALNRDPNVWGADADVFRPERWLEADPAQLALMERSNLYFSAGRRLCIGQHVAWIEMKKYLPELLSRFDVELKYPEQPLKVNRVTMVFSVEEMLIKLTPRPAWPRIE